MCHQRYEVIIIEREKEINIINIYFIDIFHILYLSYILTSNNNKIISLFDIPIISNESIFWLFTNNGMENEILNYYFK